MAIAASVGVCLVLALAAQVLLLNGCARASGKADLLKVGGVAGQETGDARDVSALKGQKEKLSYALGMLLGKQLRDQSIEVDLDLYGQGLKDALSGGKLLLIETEARAAVNKLQKELKRPRIISQAVSAALTDIEVSFKLDSRLTRGMYMGDRWVSLPNFMSVHDGRKATVEARAQGLDAKGGALKISPEWIPEDPEMVTITPGQGAEVKITVQREGQSKLKVLSSGVSAELVIKATYQADTTQVEISQ